MTLRPFAPVDVPDVNALHRSVWWPERSPGGWRWLEANPAREALGAPTGWVIEDDKGRPAAFLGNLVQRFWQGETSQFGATGFSIIVPPAVRGRSRALIRTFLDQPGLFAAYTLNANARSAPIYAQHGLEHWPAHTHALKLSWVIDPLTCLHSRILRDATQRAPRWTDPFRERFMPRRLGSQRPVSLPENVEPLSVFTDTGDYANLWTALKTEGRLIADRSPETLRWRLADPDRTLPPLVLAYRREGRITGYAFANFAKYSEIEPATLEIIDLVALKDEPDAIPALVGAMMRHARANGAAKLRLQVLGPALLSRLGRHGRTARREGGWGHGHARFAADGPSIASWSPTPFDGDHAFCQRAVPLHGARVRAPLGARQPAGAVRA